MANNGWVAGNGRSKIKRYTRRQLREVASLARREQELRRAGIRGARNGHKTIKPDHLRKHEDRRIPGGARG